MDKISLAMSILNIYANQEVLSEAEEDLIGDAIAVISKEFSK